MPTKKTRSRLDLGATGRGRASTLPSTARGRASTLEKPAALESPAAAAIYAVVRAIPRGKVATYGQVAELAGIANGHRIAARCMRTCPAKLPWYRVVGKKDARRAQINLLDPEQAALQRTKLTAEGVRFDAAGFIVLRAFGWLPN
jgi:methylated-DNA-protein-cysteine methyltransferase-like protein